MHGACGQRCTVTAWGRAVWERAGADSASATAVPEPRLAGSCRQRNGADGEHAVRTLRGTQSLRRGWQLQPPHADWVSCLAPRRQQLLRCAEPPRRVGTTPTVPGTLPHERDPVLPTLGPDTKPNPDLQVLPLPARSTTGPRGWGRERKREEVSAGCAPRVPTAHVAQAPHPLCVQVCAGTPPHLPPSPSAGVSSGHPGCQTTLRARTKPVLPGPCLHPPGRGGQGWPRLRGRG